MAALPQYLILDVESVGLHGEAFAVGFVVVNRDGQELERGCYSCDPSFCAGQNNDRVWINENCPKLTITHPDSKSLRDAFWERWLFWKETGTIMIADCGWPVEARFLAQCVDDDPAVRKWNGPYPLHDLASLLLARGRNPLTVFDRREGELPVHNPCADALQSARIFLETL